MVGVALFGFTLSYDEFARTLLTAGSNNTLPLEIFGMTTNVTTPVVYALGTVTTGVSFLVIGWRWSASRYSPAAAPACAETARATMRCSARVNTSTSAASASSAWR